MEMETDIMQKRPTDRNNMNEADGLIIWSEFTTTFAQDVLVERLVVRLPCLQRSNSPSSTHCSPL